MARPAGELWALHDLLQPFRSLANGRHLRLDHEVPFGDPMTSSVQMIDTSIVRVHQHGGCAGRGRIKTNGPVERWANDQNTRLRRYQRNAGSP